MFIPLVNFLVTLLHFFILTFQDLKVVLCGPPNFEKGSRTNAVVLDAGSTGSRAVIFNLLIDNNNQDSGPLYPKILLPIRYKKIQSSLVNCLRSYFEHLNSSCCKDEHDAEVHSCLLDHIRVLRAYIDDNIAPEQRRKTVILVRGTAGFRLLDRDTLNVYHLQVDKLLRREFRNYALTDDTFKVYSGTEEAAAGFIAMKSLVTVNCIDDVYGDVLDVDKLDADLSNGSLDASRSEHCRNKHRLFMFEVGGTSAQVGIELESPIHESFSKLEDLEDGGYLQRSALDPSMSIIHYKGRQLPVRLHSFLGQGIYIALMRYLRMLRRPGARHVDAACIPRGMNVEIVDDPTVVLRILHEHNLDSYTGTSTLAVGTSDFATCYRQVGELVHATLDGQVSYGSDVSLYGTENFISLLRDLSLPVDGSLKVTPRVLLDLAQGVCAEDKATLFTILPSTVRVQHMCFGLTFLALLSKAISGLGDDAEIIVKDRIHDTPASWTIGTVLLELPMVLRKSL